MKLPEYEKHPKYSFEDANVAFIVEDRVKFDIHRYFLQRDSEFFNAILAAQSSHPDGIYRVPRLKVYEFESLLDFFYEGMYRVSPADTPIESWVNILSIATNMEFPRAREHAIVAIDVYQGQSNSSGSLTPARMIQLANTYGVEKWLEPAYEALAERDEMIDEEEAETIGMRGVLRIMKAQVKIGAISEQEVPPVLDLKGVPSSPVIASGSGSLREDAGSQEATLEGKPRVENETVPAQSSTHQQKSRHQELDPFARVAGEDDHKQKRHPAEKPV
ncbi:hypothetical protein AAF712_015203 [Marasmius tenuissimus]|uniref:BTB domain-containing protein n=1 Tax=Marasmius tenuissimus TaxID=585030 RepID=A0ABR2ZCC0_9AGAR